MGITAAIAGGLVALGASAGAAAVGSAMIVGAIVGAAIGGISAAITGGNILQGVLFGAVGGAVTGGLGSYLGGAGGAAGGTSGAGVATGAGQTALATGMSVTETAAIQAGATTTSVATTTGAAGYATAGNLGSISGTLSTIGSNLADKFGGKFIEGVATAYMDGRKMDKEFENQMAMLDKKQAHDLALIEKNASVARAGGAGGGGTPSDPRLEIAKINSADRRAELGETRRQYDVARQDKLDADAEIKAAAKDRQKLFSGFGKRGTTNADDVTALGTVQGQPSAEEQVANAETDAVVKQTALLPEEEL